MKYDAVRAYADEETIAAALVYDVPAAHEIALWLRQQPELVAVVKMDGLYWINTKDSDDPYECEIHHAHFGDYVVLKPTGFEIVRGEED